MHINSFPKALIILLKNLEHHVSTIAQEHLQKVEAAHFGTNNSHTGYLKVSL
jgi:hypothetical protein